MTFGGRGGDEAGGHAMESDIAIKGQRQRSESELNAIPNFGKRSTDEVKDALNALGLSLRDE